MNRMKWVVAGLAATLAVGTVVVSSQGTRRIYGAGTNSCAHWTDSRQKNEGWVTSGQWLLGFVSAANVYASAPPSDTDSRAIASWMDSYCSTHADQDLSDAAQELVLFLMAGSRP
jgi:hypothetical protein